MTAQIDLLDLSNTSTLTLKGHAQKTNETVEILNEFIANTSLSGQILTLNTYVNATFAKNTYVRSTYATNTYVKTTFAANTYVNQYANASNMLIRLKTVDGSGSGLDADLLDGQNSAYYNDLTNSTNTIPDANLPSRIQKNNTNSTITDFNNAVENGFYKTTSSALNAPVADYGHLIVVAYDGANHRIQYWYKYSSDDFYVRRCVSGVWQSWKKINNQDQNDGRYLLQTDYTAADIKTKLLTVDGAGSTIDSDLLDGQHGSYYVDLTNSTGTLPDANLNQRIGVISTIITDWNDATSNGWYRGNGAANAPSNTIVGTTAWVNGRVECFANTYIIQTVWGISSSPLSTDTKTAMRVCTNGSWSSWFKVMISQSEMDSRYLGISATAADSSKLGGVAAASFAQLNTAATFGNLTSTGTVTASQNFVSSTTNAVLAGGGGAAYLRPNGAGDGTGQFYVTSTGAAVVSGTLTVSGATLTATSADASFSTVSASTDITATRYLYGQYVNMSHAAATRNSDTVFYSSTDAFVRKNTAAGFKTSLSISVSDVSGAVSTTTQVIAGNGLTGGGTLAANRTITLGTPLSITNSTTNQVTATQHTHALGFTAAEVYTGTDANETVFPLGHVIYIANSTDARQTAVTVWLSTNGLFYSTASGSTTCSGTWRMRGTADGRGVAQRTA